MERERAITILKEHRRALESRGVRRAALFGSTARGTAGPKSDVDILIELDPAAPIGVFAYTGIKQYIEEMFDGRVDVVERDALKPPLRGIVENDAIYAF